MLLTRKFPEIRDPIILSYPVISAVLLRWGNSAGCELIADRLGRGFLPLWGVVNNTGIYFSMISGWPETGFLSRIGVTVRKFWKKTGFWGILTADVGGCTLMDADVFSLVLDIWLRGNLVFSRRVCYCWQKC